MRRNGIEVEISVEKKMFRFGLKFSDKKLEKKISNFYLF